MHVCFWVRLHLSRRIRQKTRRPHFVELPSTSLRKWSYTENRSPFKIVSHRGCCLNCSILDCLVLQASGYGKEVDWWSLGKTPLGTTHIHTQLRILTVVCTLVGIVCFELLTGWPPFYDRDFSKMCEKILYKPLSFPSTKVVFECLYFTRHSYMYACMIV